MPGDLQTAGALSQIWVALVVHLEFYWSIPRKYLHPYSFLKLRTQLSAVCWAFDCLIYVFHLKAGDSYLKANKCLFALK